MRKKNSIAQIFTTTKNNSDKTLKIFVHNNQIGTKLFYITKKNNKQRRNSYFLMLTKLIDFSCDQTAKIPFVTKNFFVANF